MMAAPTKTSSTESIWKALCQEVRDVAGGEIHPALELRENKSYRGVYCHQSITQHEVLIRLPLACAIHGRGMPREYNSTESTTASNWLRCLAALCRHQTSRDKSSPYLDSLPMHFETLWEWTKVQADDFLAGTTPAVNLLVDGSSNGTNTDDKSSWYVDPNVIQQRYTEHIQPYLAFCQLEWKDVASFRYACQTISTRAFHLATNDKMYPGPYLLPVIDLLNHSSQEPVTTLQFRDGCFIMVAECDIVADSEIVHSYGPDLTASQSLQTFGFVARQDSLQTLRESLSVTSVTPVVLATKAVLEACWSTIESSLPQQLATSMQDLLEEDEAWDMPKDYRQRDFSFLPDNVLVSVEEPLPDTLVTAACLSFLPSCAYAEAKTALLDASLLEDYFLGKLVATSLLRLVSARMQDYRPIVWKGQRYTDDATLLQQLVSSEDFDAERERLIYALTVRLQEQQSWNALRRKVVEVLALLDEEAVDEDDESADGHKRQRL